MERQKYTPYEATPLEKRIDGFLQLISPGMVEKRMISRERSNRFRYLAASANNKARRNATPFDHSGETQRGNRERMQLTWNALEEVENSGLASSIRYKFIDYLVGSLRYQARTGDRYANADIEAYMRAKLGKAIDLASRHTFRQMAGCMVNGMVVKGDCGLNIVRLSTQTATGATVYDKELYFQGIEADRIGHPYDYRATQNYIGGCWLNDVGGYEAFDIFTQDRMSGTYHFTQCVPAFNDEGLPRFLMAMNARTSFDEVRGRSVFAPVLENMAYLRQMRDFELQALMWAASQSGVYTTKDGGMPDNTFETYVGQDGIEQYSFRVRPNEIQSLGIGETVSMFQHDRPSPNVLGMYRDVVREVAAGVRLSFQMVWDWTGASGPGVRGASAQDKRSLATWKADLVEDVLRPAATLIIGNGIENRDIRYHPRWSQGAWIFPPHPTIDAGRDSQADVNEYAAGLTSAHRVLDEESEDFEEIASQCGSEADSWITIAKNLAVKHGVKDWQTVYAILRNNGGVPIAPVVTDEQKRMQDFATSNGAELE